MGSPMLKNSKAGADVVRLWEVEPRLDLAEQVNFPSSTFDNESYESIRPEEELNDHGDEYHQIRDSRRGSFHECASTSIPPEESFDLDNEFPEAGYRPDLFD
jgi:hypothetical protein